MNGQELKEILKYIKLEFWRNNIYYYEPHKKIQ